MAYASGAGPQGDGDEGPVLPSDYFERSSWCLAHFDAMKEIGKGK